MCYRYVFDLDNTLVKTSILNNNSYNYALQQQALLPISNEVRITREVITAYYPQLSNQQKQEIIRLKQEFFVKNIHHTVPNKFLFNTLRSKDLANCILWTSAEKVRVQALMGYYGINKSFREVIYSNKEDVSKDISKMCTIFGCRMGQLIFYEDDKEVIKKLNKLGLCARS